MMIQQNKELSGVISVGSIWSGAMLLYSMHRKIAGEERNGKQRSRSGANNRTNSQTQVLTAKSL